MSKEFTVNDIFSHEKVSDTLYVVKESYSWDHRFPIGVAIGKDKAAVIDSGLGCAGDLRKYIEENITDKPLICIVTHLHPDHAAGAVLFDERYCSEKDWPNKEVMLNPQKRLDDIVSFSLNNPIIMEYGKDHLLDCSNVTFQDVKDGDRFDLGGGVVLDIIGMPGHTKGQVAVYNAKEKYCFVSDSILKRTHFNSLKIQDFRDYMKVLDNFLNKVDPDTIIYNGHEQPYIKHDGPLTVQLAKDLKQCCYEIAEKKNLENDEVRAAFFKSEKTEEVKNYIHVVGSAAVIYSGRIFNE